MTNETNNTATTGSNYTNAVVELIKGDDAAKTAVKIQKQMLLAFDSQVALRQAERSDLEDALDKAKTSAKNALYNYGSVVNNRTSSVQNYINSRVDEQNAQLALDNHDQVSEWLKEGLEVIKG